MSALVTVRGLTKSYGDLQVLKGVDFQVERGEVVAIIGPSGSGKTTMLRCINLLEKPTGGRIVGEGSGASATAGNRGRCRREVTPDRRRQGDRQQRFGIVGFEPEQILVREERPAGVRNVEGQVGPSELAEEPRAVGIEPAGGFQLRHRGPAASSPVGRVIRNAICAGSSVSPSAIRLLGFERTPRSKSPSSSVMILAPSVSCVRPCSRRKYSSKK